MVDGRWPMADGHSIIHKHSTDFGFSMNCHEIIHIEIVMDIILHNSMNELKCFGAKNTELLKMFCFVYDSHFDSGLHLLYSQGFRMAHVAFALQHSSHS